MRAEKKHFKKTNKHITKAMVKSSTKLEKVIELFSEYKSVEDIQHGEAFYLISSDWFRRWAKRNGLDLSTLEYCFAWTFYLTQLTAEQQQRQWKPLRVLGCARVPYFFHGSEGKRSNGSKRSADSADGPNKIRRRKRGGRKSRSRRFRKARRKMFLKRIIDRLDNSDIIGVVHENALLIYSDVYGNDNGNAPITWEFAVSFAELQSGLIEGRDYAVIPESVWNYLKDQKDIENNCVPIVRRYVPELGCVEVHPTSLSFFEPTGSNSSKIPIFASKTAHFGTLRAALSSKYGKKGCKDVRIWQGTNFSKVLSEWRCDSKTFDEFEGLQLSVRMFSKEKEAEEARLRRRSLLNHVTGFFAWVLGLLMSIVASVLCSLGLGLWDEDEKYDQTVPDDGKVAGVCGLKNIGNTCFMNSALQCLSNTPSFTEYFANGKYKEAIEGAEGNWTIVETFGKLLERMWSKMYSCCDTTTFKRAFSARNKEFRGFAQQDAHEFLTLLFDNLDTDLKKLNSDANVNTVVADTFEGQRCQSYECSECHWKSTSREPFTILSLPIPLVQHMVEVVVVFEDTLVPVKYGITYTDEKIPTVGSAKAQLGNLSQTHDLILVLDNGTAVGDKCLLPLNELSMYFYAVKKEASYDKDHKTLVYLENIANIPFHEDEEDADYEEGSEEESGEEDENEDEEEDEKSAEESDEEEDEKEEEEGEKSGEETVTENALKPVAVGFPIIFQLDTKEKESNSEEDNDDNDDMIDAASLYARVWDKTRIKGFKFTQKGNEKYPFALFGVMSDSKSLVRISPNQSSKVNLGLFKSGDGAAKIEVHWGDVKNIDDIGLFVAFKKDESFDALEDQQKKKNDNVTLDDCFDLFARKKPLSNGFECPKCGKGVQGDENVEISRPPNALVVHLMRFNNNLRKIDRPVDFELDSWSLKYVSDSAEDEGEGEGESETKEEKYRLYGIVSHNGYYSNGHYVAYAQNRVNGKWYHFNDEKCEIVDEKSIDKDNAYILFYEKIDKDD